jgi:hypothetical protein
MKVVDLLLHYHKTRPAPPNPEIEKSFPPLSERVEITRTLWIGRIPESTVQRIFQTWRPGAYGFERPQLVCRQLYAYGKEVPPELAAEKERWDESGTLTTLVALSRLVHPTSASLRTAVRVETDAFGEVTWISQARLEGVQIDAFTAANEWRDWLTLDEIKQLKEIAWPLDGQDLPRRIWSALWFHEYLFRTYEMDLRWPLAATALEALLKTKRQDTGGQFRVRSMALASELGVTGYGKAEAEEAWDKRSGLAHGQDLGKLSGNDLRLYNMIELLLRTALLRALREQEFRKIFENNSSIERRWGVRR